MGASDEGLESAIEIEECFDGLPQCLPRCLEEDKQSHCRMAVCVMVEGERKVVASCRSDEYEVLAFALKLPLYRSCKGHRRRISWPLFPSMFFSLLPR